MKFLLLIFITFPLFSQPWMNELNEFERHNYYAIQKSFNNWVKDKNPKQKGLGIKQFKRWEEFWRTRIYPDGSFPKGNELDILFDNIKKTNKTKFQSANEWTFMGRTSSPGGYNGLGRVNVVVDDPNNSNIWWIGAASGGLWKTTNKGQSWTSNTDNTTNLSTLGISGIAINPNNSNIMYLGTGDRDGYSTYGVGVLKSTNGGQSWEKTGLSYAITNFRQINRVLIDPSNTNKIFAGTNGGIYISTDAGANWSKTLDGDCKDIEFKPSNSSIVYATLHKNPGAFYKSTDGGTNWTAITNGLPTSDIRRIEIAVTPAGSNNVYLLACKDDNGLKGVYLSTDSGDSFSKISGTENMLGHQADGSGTGGQGWYDMAIAVPNNDKNTIIVGGVSTWKTTNLGTSWALCNFWYDNGQVPAVHADQHDFRFTADHTLLVGNDGGVYASTDKGSTWKYLSTGLGITQYYKITASDNYLNHIIGGSQDNGTMIKKKDSTWVDVIGGDGMKCLFDPKNDLIIYGSMQHGIIVKSTNAGQNFRRINDENFDNEYDDITESGPWVTPYDLDPSNTDIMYVGMQSIWKSTDGGKNFTKKTLGNNYDFDEVYVSAKNPNYVYAATSNQFYRSTDKGETWTQVSRPGTLTTTDFCIHPNNENILWATNGGWSASSKVFYSTDGGSNWANISSGLPNLPINCVQFGDENVNRVYVGTDIGIYYRDDNSNGWVNFSEGLPNVIVSDIEYQKSTGRLYAGTYGRGFWFRDLVVDLDDPVLVSPLSGTHNYPFNNAAFKWNKVNLATQYHLQISKSSNFLTLEYEKTNITDTALIVPTLSKFQQYFWRVKAKAGVSESDWSITWNFKTKIGSTSLIAPDSNSFNNPISTTLKWLSINGADSYKIQVSTDPTFNNIDFELTANNEQINVSNLTYHTKYYWRVCGVNSEGDGDWSNVWHFTTMLAKPELSLPDNELRNISFDMVLVWQSVTGAQTYDIQVDDNSDFSSLERETLNHGLIELNVVNLTPATKYNWRVKAHNSNSSSDWSDTWVFYTKLAKNTLISPVNDSTFVDTNVRLTWTKAPKGDSNNVQVATDKSFSNVLYQATLNDSSKVFSDLAYNKAYYWRVKSSSTFGNNDWSDVWTFTTKLKEVSLTQPADESENVNINTEFKWEQSAGATKYAIQIFDDVNLTNKIHENTSVSNSYVYLLQKNKNYYWRIQAQNDTNKSNWSQVYNFSTPIESPVLVSPANNTTLTNTSVELVWKNISGATEYTAFLSTTNQFNDNLLTNNTTSSTSITANSLEINKDYFWRVKAKVNGQDTEFSETWKFRIEKLVLTSPANNSTLNDNNVVLKWNAFTGATGYLVFLSNTNQFEDNLINNNSVSQNSISLSSLEFGKDYFWRIKALNGSQETDFSETWKFTLEKDLILPGNVTLILPENGKVDVDTLNLKFEWESASNADSYTFELSENTNFTPLIENKTNLTTTEIVIDELVSNKEYFWRVKAKNDDGESQYSDVWTFTTIKSQSPNSVNIAYFDNVEYTIYPNPAKENLYIKSNKVFNIDLVEILDANGKLVYHLKPSKVSLINVDLSKFTNGVYVIKLVKGNDLKLLKFIKD